MDQSSIAKLSPGESITPYSDANDPEFSGKKVTLIGNNLGTVF